MDSPHRLLDQPTPLEIRASTCPERSRLEELSGMQGLLQLMGATAAEALCAAQVPVLLHRLGTDDTLFREGAPAQAIYFVRGGTLKTYRTAEDGYEQVLGFSGRAEMLGFEALGSGLHLAAAAALEPSSVYVILLRDLPELAQTIPAFNLMLHRAASAALRYRSERCDVMEAVAADVRLGRFLLHLSQHMAACGQSPRRFHLRMGRRDIASYLGVAHETVSRSFSALAGWGLVGVHNREVEILDLPGLLAFSGSTRRQVDAATLCACSLRAAAAHRVPAQMAS